MLQSTFNASSAKPNRALVAAAGTQGGPGAKQIHPSGNEMLLELVVKRDGAQVPRTSCSIKSFWCPVATLPASRLFRRSSESRVVLSFRFHHSLSEPSILLN